MRKKHRTNVIFRVALILLCLVLFSAHLSSGMLAKYTADGIVDKAARVASTDITITAADDPVVIGTDGAASLSFNVKNDSDVALQYSVIVIPKSSTLTAAQLAQAFVDPKIGDVAGVYDAADGSYTFSTATQFIPGEDVDMTLTFSANDIVTVAAGTQTVDYADITLYLSTNASQLD